MSLHILGGEDLPSCQGAPEASSSHAVWPVVGTQRQAHRWPEANPGPREPGRAGVSMSMVGRGEDRALGADPSTPPTPILEAWTPHPCACGSCWRRCMALDEYLVKNGLGGGEGLWEGRLGTPGWHWALPWG